MLLFSFQSFPRRNTHTRLIRAELKAHDCNRWEARALTVPLTRSKRSGEKPNAIESESNPMPLGSETAWDAGAITKHPIPKFP